MARIPNVDDYNGKANPAKKKRKVRRKTARKTAARPRAASARPKKAPARRAIAKRSRNPARRLVRAVASTKVGRASDVNLFHLLETDPELTGSEGRSWKLPAGLVKSKDFQAWAYGMNYAISATRMQLVAKLRRFV